MEIREGKSLSLFHGQDARIVDWNEYRSNMGMLGWADQVICAKNATRIGLNQQMRYDLYGWEDPLPQPGDKIICLRNNWDCINPVGDNLVNGLTGHIDEITYKTRECFCYTPSMFATFVPDYVDENVSDKVVKIIMILRPLWRGSSVTAVFIQKNLSCLMNRRGFQNTGFVSPYNKYSIVHGIILEPKTIRYYPYGEFMSNIL